MTTSTKEDALPWYSPVVLVGHLFVSLLIGFFTASSVVPAVPRWTVTGIWVALTAGYVIYERFHPNTGGRDENPVDYWTIAHTLAGVVAGLWYVPLVYLLILVFLWEVFEFAVKGFGEKEEIRNRLVDMGVALGAWILVVIPVMIFTGAPFPLADRYTP